jgi:hypothetical protein
VKSKTTRIILNSLLTLMLLAGILATIVPASPVMAAELIVTPFNLTTSGGGTAQWITSDNHTGTSSAPQITIWP